MFQVGGREAASSKHGQTDLFCPHLMRVYSIFIAPRAAGSRNVPTALQCALEEIQESFDSLTHTRLVSSKPTLDESLKKTFLLHLLDNTEDFVRFRKDMSFLCVFVCFRPIANQTYRFIFCLLLM